MAELRSRGGNRRNRQVMVRWLRCLAPVGLLALGGCAIGMPYRTVSAPPDPGAPVVVALTWATVDPQRRASFDRYTARLLDILPQQPGLLGYSVRREVFGNEAWTMTVWSSDEARRAFVHSPLHQEAILESYAAVTRTRFVRYVASPAELPPRWDDSLRRLQASGSGYGP